ncbi:unnamed protein product [Arabidopsis halleri]
MGLRNLLLGERDDGFLIISCKLTCTFVSLLCFLKRVFFFFTRGYSVNRSRYIYQSLNRIRFVFWI